MDTKSEKREILTSGEFVISLVLSHHIKSLKPQEDQCYSSVLFRKQRKRHPRGMRAGRLKRYKEKGSPWLNSGSSFDMFFLLPLNLPCVNWSSQESCLFHLRSSLGSSGLPVFYFHRLAPSLSFSHCHFGLLFHILTT